MPGITKIEIRESVEELKLLMKQQKTGLRYAKVQSLYLLKIKVVENINYIQSLRINITIALPRTFYD